VVPFTRQVNPDPFLIAVGASFGAYHAVHFALRHPEQVGRALGLSGLYDLGRFTGGFCNEDVYLHTPCLYISNEHDPRRLAALRRQDVILAVGRDDALCGSSQQLSGLLWDQGVGNALRVWDGWCHDWPYWARMLLVYLGGHD
jgi:esterase/lipase superfamily enzyme